MEENFIEICVGIGMNQFFPEYIKIYIEELDSSENEMQNN